MIENIIEVLQPDEIEQVSGGDAWNRAALVGGTFAAGAAGAFVAPAVVGSVFIAATTYLVAYGFGAMYNKCFNRA